MHPGEFESVLTAAQQGAEWAWSSLYADLAPEVLGYFRVRRAPDPEDLVGEVFVQLARNLGRFRGDYSSFRSWVFMIAHNRLSNRRRRHSRKGAEPVPDAVARDSRQAASAETHALDRLASDDIMAILEALTSHQREVIALRVVADQSLEETARIMGKSVGSVKQLQRRALQQLRREIETQAVTP